MRKLKKGDQEVVHEIFLSDTHRLDAKKQLQDYGSSSMMKDSKSRYTVQRQKNYELFEN